MDKTNIIALTFMYWLGMAIGYGIWHDSCETHQVIECIEYSSKADDVGSECTRFQVIEYMGAG